MAPIPGAYHPSGGMLFNRLARRKTVFTALEGAKDRERLGGKLHPASVAQCPLRSLIGRHSSKSLSPSGHWPVKVPHEYLSVPCESDDDCGDLACRQIDSTG